MLEALEATIILKCHQFMALRNPNAALTESGATAIRAPIYSDEKSAAFSGYLAGLSMRLHDRTRPAEAEAQTHLARLYPEPIVWMRDFAIRAFERQGLQDGLAGRSSPSLGNLV